MANADNKIYIDGAWKSMVNIYTNINGEWKIIDSAYVNINSEWKQFWFSMFVPEALWADGSLVFTTPGGGVGFAEGSWYQTFKPLT